MHPGNTSNTILNEWIQFYNQFLNQECEFYVRKWADYFKLGEKDADLNLCSSDGTQIMLFVNWLLIELLADKLQ